MEKFFFTDLKHSFAEYLFGNHYKHYNFELKINILPL